MIVLGIIYGVGWLACIFVLRSRVAENYPNSERESPHSNDAYTAFLALIWPLWIVVALFSLAGRIGRR